MTVHLNGQRDILNVKIISTIHFTSLAIWENLGKPPERKAKNVFSLISIVNVNIKCCLSRTLSLKCIFYLPTHPLCCSALCALLTACVGSLSKHFQFFAASSCGCIKDVYMKRGKPQETQTAGPCSPRISCTEQSRGARVSPRRKTKTPFFSSVFSPAQKYILTARDHSGFVCTYSFQRYDMF